MQEEKKQTASAVTAMLREQVDIIVDITMDSLAHLQHEQSHKDCMERLGQIESNSPSTTTVPGTSRMKVVVVSGPTGAGKTSFLRQILSSTSKLHLACIVNSSVSTDDDAVAEIEALKNASSNNQTTKVVAMRNGCVCCSLREDLVEKVAELARDPCDYLLLEVACGSEPLAIARALSLTARNGTKLADFAKLDTMVTVLDASNVGALMSGTETLKDVGQSTGPEDERTVCDVLMEQIEIANVILVNKVDTVAQEQVNLVKSLASRLNPSAKVFSTEQSALPWQLVLGTGMFDMTHARTSMGWAQELRSNTSNSQLTRSADRTGVSLLVFRSRRPFHPGRLAQAMQGFGFSSSSGGTQNEGPFRGVVRSKGIVWLANVHQFKVAWHSAGGNWSLQRSHPFYAAMPEHLWEMSEKEREALKTTADSWDPVHGDRSTELVCIGTFLDDKGLLETLESALLDEKEMRTYPGGWTAVPNSFFQSAEQSQEKEESIFEDAFGNSLLDFQFSSWRTSKLKKHTIKSSEIELPGNFVQYLLSDRIVIPASLASTKSVRELSAEGQRNLAEIYDYDSDDEREWQRCAAAAAVAGAERKKKQTRQEKRRITRQRERGH